MELNWESYMLSFDVLIEQARLRGMPATKMRGILREYLQILILKAIYGGKLGKKLYFTGGTYLRMVHDLKRFSEDLDFNARNLKTNTFETHVNRVKVELARIGIECKVQFGHWNGLLVAKFLFPDIESHYGIVSKYTAKMGIAIKFEVYSPKWKLEGEPEVISGFGVTFPCVCTKKTAFFADKIDAFMKKEMARHLYDIIFMLTRQFGVNRAAAKVLGISGDPLNALESSVQKCQKSALRKKAEALRPFLFEESEANLVADAHLIIPKLIQKYKVQD